MFTVLAIVFFGGWLIAAAIGTWAYFAGEGVSPNVSQK